MGAGMWGSCHTAARRASAGAALARAVIRPKSLPRPGFIPACLSLTEGPFP